MLQNGSTLRHQKTPKIHDAVPLLTNFTRHSREGKELHLFPGKKTHSMFLRTEGGMERAEVCLPEAEEEVEPAVKAYS